MENKLHIPVPKLLPQTHSSEAPIVKIFCFTFYGGYDTNWNNLFMTVSWFINVESIY